MLSGRAELDTRGVQVLEGAAVLKGDQPVGRRASIEGAVGIRADRAAGMQPAQHIAVLAEGDVLVGQDGAKDIRLAAVQGIRREQLDQQGRLSGQGHAARRQNDIDTGTLGVDERRHVDGTVIPGQQIMNAVLCGTCRRVSGFFPRSGRGFEIGIHARPEPAREVMYVVVMPADDTQRLHIAPLVKLPERWHESKQPPADGYGDKCQRRDDDSGQFVHVGLWTGFR
ncbi:MAG: hypothetical protein A2150_04690 [Candidatus Muproteobacteria bacterium RBG_16_64_11]|uniref:Uncharacterized protein n=1 Tax=Candidatus Muproteobacteria bacterium RBG_16_64_11 TaxID=1817758 RepID=A0A1F6TBD4_9PROT|nr:MAG: hypothetical protein A2150_04690 [Candidatus Muproteobacteria bacterium RBG_16_64_11]